MVQARHSGSAFTSFFSDIFLSFYVYQTNVRQNEWNLSKRSQVEKYGHHRKYKLLRAGSQKQRHILLESSKKTVPPSLVHM